jgi:hypothetical protein
VDEARAALVRPGDRVAVLLETRPAAAGDAVLDGTVIEVARAIAADQRAFTVKVALPAGMSPRTGTFARVRFDGVRRSALVVPASAVRVHGQVTSVFVVSDGRAHTRLVQVGTTDSDGIEILAGLEAGESVVAAPPVDLIDGRRVAVTVSPGAAAP